MSEAVLTTQIPGIKFLNRGKVRDIYEHEGRLLIVATDRVSAFDVVMPNGIPGKGKVLTAISLFWFARRCCARQVRAPGPLSCGP